MDKLLFYSSALAIIIELFVIPVIRKVSVDSRWSPFTFAGALLFLFASANVIHRNERLPEWLTSVHLWLCRITAMLSRSSFYFAFLSKIMAQIIIKAARRGLAGLYTLLMSLLTPRL